MLRGPCVRLRSRPYVLQFLSVHCSLKVRRVVESRSGFMMVLNFELALVVRKQHHLCHWREVGDCQRTLRLYSHSAHTLLIVHGLMSSTAAANDCSSSTCQTSSSTTYLAARRRGARLVHHTPKLLNTKCRGEHGAVLAQPRARTDRALRRLLE